ncbi:MAG TPA: hypothetical protein VEQ10_06580 [Vicinamibacteria bacterium]|nr:hypothetical protein [Vicinamibacteria bacterium]
MNARLASLGPVLLLAASLVPNFSGHWRLNRQLSDDEAAKLAAAAGKPQKQSQSAPEPDREGGAGGRGRGRGGAAAPNPAVPAVDDDPRGVQKKPEAMADITVTQSDVEVAVVDKTGVTRNYYPNGKVYKADEGASNVKSLWKDGALVFEKKNLHGWRLSETWQLSPDGKQLRFDSHFEGGGRPTIVVKRVYDRAADQ